MRMNLLLRKFCIGFTCLEERQGCVCVYWGAPVKDADFDDAEEEGKESEKNTGSRKVGEKSNGYDGRLNFLTGRSSGMTEWWVIREVREGWCFKKPWKLSEL